jgi:hypothetical protein
MADLNRVVAGIRCIEVLELLSDYLDGDVSQESKERIEAHLRGCDQCERFGGRRGLGPGFQIDKWECARPTYSARRVGDRGSSKSTESRSPRDP